MVSPFFTLPDATASASAICRRSQRLQRSQPTVKTVTTEPPDGYDGYNGCSVHSGYNGYTGYAEASERDGVPRLHLAGRHRLRQRNLPTVTTVTAEPADGYDGYNGYNGYSGYNGCNGYNGYAEASQRDGVLLLHLAGRHRLRQRNLYSGYRSYSNIRSHTARRVAPGA